MYTLLPANARIVSVVVNLVFCCALTLVDIFGTFAGDCSRTPKTCLAISTIKNPSLCHQLLCQIEPEPL